ncbi:Piso0_000150 [Millerozyma farinosa CBS 7064]|uniref:Piso0_000150 protein n=1 Tax=Pichia sorbitophila (strain ATCC MYA-4447 / BCRC 22081 / CBS 7064 / NBRC 10061 / NRRL Y-12695) TaxID=559304 RepID=G8YT78_PICSO|nr:Piso0_000150 [Millerozyma farinosa CBS 7064]
MSRIYTISDLKSVSTKALRTWFQKGSPSGEGRFAVVDVRDNDYVGGHIRGSWHYPAVDFGGRLGELQRRLEDEQVNDVVFHCMLSQSRGPKAALAFLRSLDDVTGDESKEYFGKLGVWVLKGGFNAWQAEFAEDPTLTEGYEKDLWNFGM